MTEADSKAETRTTVVNYVVEACPDGKPWISMQFAGDDPEIGQQAYGNWLAGHGSLNIRLVKRTAVITDEVVRAGRQGEWWEE